MARLIKRDRGNYTNVSNNILRDSQLSWKARGIFGYLWSQANEWQFYVNEIATHATDGVKSLRSGLDELEERGYLKRVNRHSDSGNFDGMDWILDDTGSLKQSQVKFNDDRRNHLGDDAKKEQKPPKKCPNTSDAKSVERETGSTPNRPLRNNNNKNYQNKEITTERNSLSNEADQKIKDPFYQPPVTKSEREKQIDDLIYKFVMHIPGSIDGSLVQQIRNVVVRIPFDSAESCVNQTIQAVSTGRIQNPPAYLISLLKNAKE